MFPLSGFRVLDLSRVLAGPFATQQLLDLGAEVIKIEDPRAGDLTRSWGPPFVGDDRSAYFLTCNRGKRSVALDLGHEEGRRIVHELVRQSHAVVENFREGQLEAWGISLAEWRLAQSDLVTVSIRGFPSNSSRARDGGYDALIQAQFGLSAITGPEEGNGSKVGVAVVDLFSGLQAATALTGLWAAQARGPLPAAERHVEIALSDACLSLLANVATSYLNTGIEPKRYGNQHPQIVPYQPFPARDGEFFIAACSDREWGRLARAAGQPEWASGWATNAERVADRDAVVEAMSHFTRTRDRRELEELCRKARVPGGAVRGVSEAFASPEAKRAVLEHDDGTRSVRSPMRFSQTAPRDSSAPSPRLGEHPAEVLEELGYSGDEIRDLAERGICRL